MENDDIDIVAANINVSVANELGDVFYARPPAAFHGSTRSWSLQVVDDTVTDFLIFFLYMFIQ